jgi:hypothetical protein
MDKDRKRPDRYKSGQSVLPEVLANASVRRHAGSTRMRGRFLKGPVPWEWFLAASRLGGKAIHVGLAVWQKRGMTGDPVVLSLSSLAMGFDRSTASRGLAALERASLVRVDRSPGQAPRITVIDPEASHR